MTVREYIDKRGYDHVADNSEIGWIVRYLGILEMEIVLPIAECDPEKIITVELDAGSLFDATNVPDGYCVKILHRDEPRI